VSANELATEDSEAEIFSFKLNGEESMFLFLFYLKKKNWQIK